VVELGRHVEECLPSWRAEGRKENPVDGGATGLSSSSVRRSTDAAVREKDPGEETLPSSVVSHTREAVSCEGARSLPRAMIPEVGTVLRQSHAGFRPHRPVFGSPARPGAAPPPAHDAPTGRFPRPPPRPTPNRPRSGARPHHPLPRVSPLHHAQRAPSMPHWTIPFCACPSRARPPLSPPLRRERATRVQEKVSINQSVKRLKSGDGTA
jgi:hypothetical protein